MTVNFVEENQRERSTGGGDGESGGCCSRKFCWWNPPQEAVVSEFFNESSLHGLQYVGQPKRHILERIFWLISFIIGVIAAGFLVYAMIQRYEDTPVIVSFQSKEQPINTIPFPAVTICSMNQFSKKKVLEMERIAGLPTHKNSKEAKRNLSLVNELCQSHKTFVQSHDDSYIRGRAKSDVDNNDFEENMMDFLVEVCVCLFLKCSLSGRTHPGKPKNHSGNEHKFNLAFWHNPDNKMNTIPCEQLIPLRNFHGYSMSSDEDFFPVITDFGKCCTFNMLPLPLMFRNPSIEANENVTMFDNPILGSNMQWNNSVTEAWSKWNYDRDKGFVFSQYDSEKPYQYYPIKQQGPGKPYGLSILIDPLIDDFYCPMSDAEGIVFTLHKPIEMPNIREFPSLLDTNKEIHIKIEPEITFADPDIRDLSSEKRQCYYGKEKELKHYRPYTRENCIDDCVANEIIKQCNCTFYDLPRDEGVRLCKTEDTGCVDYNVGRIRSFAKHVYCGHCLALCEDIDYKYEATMMTMRNASQIWVDRDRIRKEEDSIPEWANHKVSIVHFFFGNEATVPKLRKRLYGVTDLIANAGGILGLCLGFSALSLVECVYFVLVRALGKRCNQPNVCGVGRRIRPLPKTCEGSNLQHVEAPPTS